VGTTHSVKACKEELLFNPIKNECDWAMNVNAKNKIQTDLDFKFKNKIKNLFFILGQL
jgi:ribosome-associated toxin RatA of RatAB toxin-antitoxin module